MSNFCLNCEIFTNSDLNDGLCNECNIRNYLKRVKMDEKQQLIEEKRLCLYCNKTLVAIASSRKNGTFGCDWKKRRYHKRCYKLQNEMNFINLTT